VDRFQASATGFVVTPPPVTATKDNSIVVVVGVLAHDEGVQDLIASYATNGAVTQRDGSTDVIVFVGEVEINTGLYTPPAMTFTGTGDSGFSWVAFSVLLTPP
jgi:hypothetical protein